MNWKVFFTNKAAKQLTKLPESIILITRALVNELEVLGPIRNNWKNFGKLKSFDDTFHCHIKNGRPTYVVCWQVKDKKIKIIEVYYVGTHENAPY